MYYCCLLMQSWKKTGPGRTADMEVAFHKNFSAPKRAFRMFGRKGTVQCAVIKKVPLGRHVRTGGTHTGKFDAESVRGPLGPSAWFCGKFCLKGGYQGGKDF